MRMLAKVRRLGWAERGLLLEAAFWLGLARLGLLAVPFRRIAPLLGIHMAQAAEAVTQQAQTQAQRVGWAVSAIARRTPWESACLAQAMSAKAMLRRRGVASTLYLGLARDEEKALKAHAWLRCGRDVITGGEISGYTIISSFAEEHGAGMPPAVENAHVP